MRYATKRSAGEIQNLPGCNAVAVMHAFFMFPAYRHLGLGHAEHEVRLKKAKSLGYDYALCSVVSTNTAQLRIVARAGWKELAEFENSNTGNKVKLFGKELREC